ncbi:MSHA fimbrial biogenesis protein MshM [soil metagenome]
MTALRFPRRPFRSTPSPELYVPTPAHSATLQSLVTAVTADDGPVLLTGDAGTGKTMLALRLMVNLSETWTPVLLPTARFQTPAELHQAILFDLSQPYQGLTEQELRLTVTEQLLNLAASNHRALLVLDEAHTLGDGALQELRHFDNLTLHGEHAAALLLVGLPSIQQRLSLEQRLAITIQINALTESDATLFLKSQAASGEVEFDDEALSVIVSASHGNPRLLNRLAAASLAMSLDAGETMIDVEAALAAVELHSSAVPAQPAHLPLAAESPGKARSNTAMGHHPAPHQTPKQKARKRKAA